MQQILRQNPQHPQITVGVHRQPSWSMTLDNVHWGPGPPLQGEPEDQPQTVTLPEETGE